MIKNIILASASAQRKKLLQMAGLRFTVRPSHVEEAASVKGSCSALVKHNALLKAQEVARRAKAGIVVGADTIVYAGQGRIIGKPKDLKDAKRILKILFSCPQWVYTGVAVIDAATGKTVVDYERTKVYMHHLSDEEIDRYHRLTSPLDKAGGFDIEGRGGLFINRIEGCYSNVIGLPMAKLRIMLKKLGVHILGLTLVAAALFSGCATEYNLATGQQETLMYGTEKEVKIGDAVAQQIESHYKIVTDVELNERVQRIFDRLVAVCDRRELVYTIKVLDDDMVNAVSLPGGYIYLFRGLTDKLKTDEQLAGVIGHELGHITAKHAIKRMQASYGYILAQILAVQSGSGAAARGVNAVYTSVFLSFARQDEFQSDVLGVKYMKKAGFDPRGVTEVLRVLEEEQRKAPPSEVNYWRTHPYLPERIANANKAINGQIEFRDYLNLTGTEERGY
ncbi:MAG: Maf family nucleotide pyrophosphatase [Candidatus Omnitrophota bacterium]|nr:Maf family nucleotide pyrophosphatase [Candidatus Omnitrophota bacterium]MDZ4243439.1 Maf family nucleotide pyrophosphatase [Candidatus Omnitrophota bacterium]